MKGLFPLLSLNHHYPFLIYKVSFYYLCIGVLVSVSVSNVRCVQDACKGQKRASDPVGLELQVVTCLMWVLGTELWSSERVESALNH